MILENQKAIVTGGGEGIGRGIALRLAEEGADIAVVDINVQSAEKVSEEVRKKGRKSLPLVLDVSNNRDVKKAVDTVLKEWGLIDILVNNAGISPKKKGVKVNLVEMSDEEWDRVIQVNLTGMFYFCKACLPSMMARRYGKIVNISSVSGKTGGFAGGIHYVASKAGIIGFTKTLAKEVAPYGINANVVMPSRIETKLGLNISQELLQLRLSQIPLGRFGTPEDVAEAVLFLVNHRASSWMTGATLNLSGGALMD
jgi:3-oxoacyl-[acyl-carrier protein] reductase